MPCSFEQEQVLANRGISPVAGIDEAGRGPLAGPVVAAAVVFSEWYAPAGLDDSKKLTPRKRNSLYEEIILMPSVRWAVAVLDNREVDQLNILRATHQAMREAFLSLDPHPVHALIDGLFVRDFPCGQTAIVKGDSLSLSIAAASVLAKVTRDRIMDELDRLHPEYEFSRNKGYPTARHLELLNKYGPCPVHRRSYAPVAQASLL